MLLFFLLLHHWCTNETPWFWSISRNSGIGDGCCFDLHGVFFFTKGFLATSVCRTPADVVFLLDASGSISMAETDFNWRTVLGFVEGVVNQLPVDTGDTRVALVRFSQDAEVMWNLARYNNRNDLISAIRRVTSLGERTNIASAFEAARNQILVPFGGDRSGVPNIVFLITDGQPTAREIETIPQASLLKNIATLVTVGITTETSLRDLLQQLASSFQQAYFSNVYSQLTLLSNNVLQEACRRQIAPPPVPTPAPPQGKTNQTCFKFPNQDPVIAKL